MDRAGRRSQADLPSLGKAFRSSWNLLAPAARRRYAVVVSAQMATGVLDLVGVALIGLMGLAATAALDGEGMPSVPFLADDAGGDPLQVAAILAVAAAASLMARSLAFAALLRVNYRLLVRCQVDVTSSLLATFMQRSVTDVQERSSQRVAYALTQGAAAAITSLLGSASVIFTDTALLVLIGLGLLVINPAVALASVAYLGIIALGVHWALARWSARVGSELGASGESNLVAVQETIALHRELWTMGRLPLQFQTTSADLERATRARGTQVLIGQIPRVVYDAALVVGGLLIAAWQLRVASLPDALATLLVFLAAASRVIPSLMRVNGQLVQVRSAAAQAKSTYELADRMRSTDDAAAAAPLRPTALQNDHHSAPAATVSLTDVSFTYPDVDVPVLRHVTAQFPAGVSAAIVGATGAGKSTLAEVILGLLSPQSGEVLIDGRTPAGHIEAAPGALAYVPQRVVLVEGTIRRNVAIALPGDSVEDVRVWRALERAHVADVVRDLPLGLDTQLGEHGLRLSGGQRQRIGLARALYSEPRLLVLDEATSALDAETERAIAVTLESLRGETTVLVIAHRLAAMQGADVLLYLEQGRVAATGAFAELMRDNAAFARQVELLGVSDAMHGGTH